MKIFLKVFLSNFTLANFGNRLTLILLFFKNVVSIFEQKMFAQMLEILIKSKFLVNAYIQARIKAQLKINTQRIPFRMLN